MSDTYEFTETEFDILTSLSLTHEGIAVASPGIASWVMNYRDVKSIRLNSEHLGSPDEIFRCIIDDRSGRRLVIPNTLIAQRRYTEVLYLLQNAAYRQFLVALHQRLSPQSAIKYLAGNPPPDHLGAAAILAGICSAILIPLTLIGSDGLSWPITSGVIIFAASVPFIARHFRNDPPNTYAPSALPEHFLPHVKE